MHLRRIKTKQRRCINDAERRDKIRKVAPNKRSSLLHLRPKRDTVAVTAQPRESDKLAVVLGHLA